MMKKIFICFGIATLALAALFFLLMLSSPLSAIVAAIGLAIPGALLIAVGDLLGRVEYLEEKLGLMTPPSNDPELPQSTCPACGYSYDFDYPNCPRCGGKGANSQK